MISDSSRLHTKKRISLELYARSSLWKNFSSSTLIDDKERWLCRLCLSFIAYTIYFYKFREKLTWAMPKIFIFWPNWHRYMRKPKLICRENGGNVHMHRHVCASHKTMLLDIVFPLRAVHIIAQFSCSDAMSCLQRLQLHRQNSVQNILRMYSA